jgi:hypothetical protein
MYIIAVMPETVEFIAKFLNDGVVPEIVAEKTFFIFDEDQPNEILNSVECDKRFGKPPAKPTLMVWTAEQKSIEDYVPYDKPSTEG